jgi:hypothetical protein
MERVMPIYDYVLLALLASGDHRLDTTLTLGPDAITQPKGGGLVQLAENKIKLNGIKGESLDDKHKDEINLLSRGNQNKIPLKANPPGINPQNTRMK